MTGLFLSLVDWHAWNRLISPSKAFLLGLLDQQVYRRSVDTLSDAIVFSFVSGQVSSHLKGTPSNLQLCLWTGFVTFKGDSSSLQLCAWTGFVTFKGDSKQRHELAWKHRRGANISICRLCMVVVSVFVQLRHFLLSHLNSVCGHIHLLFTNEEHRSVGSWRSA